MTVLPLFTETLADLKVKLRLSGVTMDTDAEQIIEDAVEESKLGIIDALGLSLITTLQAISPVDNPTTTDQVKRLRATLVEVFWVRAILVERLPQLFIDSSGSTMQAYNEEGIIRDVGTGSVRRQAKDLMRKVRANLNYLTGDDVGELHIVVPVPDTPPPEPWDSIRTARGSGLLA